MLATKRAAIRNRLFALSTPLALLSLAACHGPLQDSSEKSLRDSVANAVDLQLRNAPRTDIALIPQRSDVENSFTDEHLEELNQRSSPATVASEPLELGHDLTGSAFPVARLSLEEAVRFAVAHNLEVQYATLGPAIRETDVIAAEAQFDATLFSNLDWARIDQARTTTVVGGIPVGTGLNNNESLSFTTGIRKPLTTGGELVVQTGVDRSDNNTPDVSLFPDPAYSTNIQVGINQSLLRGFGTDVNLAQVRLARNQQRDEIQALKAEIEQTVKAVEEAYWNLVQSRYTLQIREQLLARGIETRDKLAARIEYDVNPAEYSDAVSRVESRRLAVMRARTELVVRSDRLKSLINAPGYEVGTEVLLEPADAFQDAPLTFNYVDAARTALQRRPEIHRALFAIDDTSIRQLLADNLRLPRLDVSASIRYNGHDDSTGGAYSDSTDDEFVDYLLSAVLEVPVGNREAEAGYTRARLQRQQAVINYAQVVQGVVQQVKEALRLVRLNFDLLSGTRGARLAAAESLRTIEVEEELTAVLSPEFLNVKFSRQEALAAAQIEEISALIAYQNALSELYLAMGLTLERNNIAFEIPDPD